MPEYTNADLELMYLQSLGAVGNYLADCRYQIYGVNRHAYFAARSGLAPASLYSLNDHMYAYFKGAAMAWTEKNRNLHTNPRGLGSAWVPAIIGGAATRTSEVAGGPLAGCPEWQKFTITTPPTASPIGVPTMASANRAAVVEGVTYRFRSFQNSDYTGFSALRIDGVWYDAGNSQISPITGASNAYTVANSWLETTQLFTPVAGAAFAALNLGYSSPQGISIGQYFGGAACMIQENTLPLVSFFDGATAPANSLEQYRWLGTPNASPSVYETRLSDVASSGSLADVQRRFWKLSLGL